MQYDVKVKGSEQFLELRNIMLAAHSSRRLHEIFVIDDDSMTSFTTGHPVAEVLQSRQRVSIEKNRES